jgi:oxygen-independent coproporphyrinogen-3 oxidase
MPEGAPHVDHVYAHFPFCVRKCPYCDFNSHAGREDEIEGYVEALLAEARSRLPGTGVRTLYVGGGTPTHADAETLGRYVRGLADAAGGVAGDLTVEANPGSLDAAKVDALREAGVRRVSLGAQSFEAKHLETLGRVHGPEATAQSVALLAGGGIEHVALDLILAIPGQTLAEQARDLEQAIALGPEHVSAYVLTIEDGTAFARRVRRGRLPAPDGDRELPHLHLAVERLEAAGLARYEISNFARPGCESRHNLAYWRDDDWVGLGAGAHSHVGRKRWKNVDDPRGYAEAIRDRGEAVEWTEALPRETRLFDALMMGLRLVEGVDLGRLVRRLDLDARDVHADAIARHVEGGRLALEGDRLRATPAGLDVLSAILVDFVPDA